MDGTRVEMKTYFLTVKELIEKLNAMPQDAVVITEGCDCNGQADGVELVNHKFPTIVRYGENFDDDECKEVDQYVSITRLKRYK